MKRATRPFQALALALAVIMAPPSVAGAASAAEPAAGFEGTWKLVVLAFGEDEFAILKIEQNDGRPSASVISAQRMVIGMERNLKITEIVIDGSSLSLVLKTPETAFQFRGKRSDAGPTAGQIVGTFTFRGEVHAARLERTESERVGDLRPSPLYQEYASAARDKDPHSKIQKLRESIRNHAGSPTSYLFYTELLSSAEAGGLGADEVGKLIQEWIKEAAPYGELWIREVRQRALRALSAAKSYPEITLELAQQVDKEIDEDAHLEGKAAVVALLARSAKLLGKPELAAEASARSARLEQRVDEEYRTKVPPFRPEKFAGRQNADADRVVLIELFTGAQCPPCVAADVAFDALLETYKPTELIGLQYHMHIPGPDPLANTYTMDRARYYEDEFQGTPTAFLNGRIHGEGGPMQLSHQRYDELRKVIDPELESAKAATIVLSAVRAGDLVEIKASATVGNSLPFREKQGDNDQPAAGGARGGRVSGKPRLRLVLAENTVRYVGRNQIRLHNHVVRALPGGPDGTDLSSGSGEVTIKVNLADLKHEIEEYVSNWPKNRPFPGMLPEVSLNDLFVVAFVQDDANKHVLDAVSVPVQPRKK